MDKRKLAGGGVLILLVVACAWAFGFLGGADPALAELEAMRAQMFDRRDVPDAQRQQLRDEFRQRLDGLSEEQRRAFFQAGRDQWMQRAEQRMDEFFAMPPADQDRELDDMLQRMQQRRNERAQNTGGNRQERGGAGRGGRGDRGNMTEAQRDERSKRRLDNTSPKMRAQFSEYRRKLTERAAKKGINPADLPGRGGPWGRGV